jgi:hypothetical protein
MSGLAFNLHVENNCLTPSFRKEEVWPINLTPSHFIKMSVPSKESERSGIYVFRQFGNCLFLKGMAKKGKMCHHKLSLYHFFNVDVVSVLDTTLQYIIESDIN